MGELTSPKPNANAWENGLARFKTGEVQSLEGVIGSSSTDLFYDPMLSLNLSGSELQTLKLAFRWLAGRTDSAIFEPLSVETVKIELGKIADGIEAFKRGLYDQYPGLKELVGHYFGDDANLSAWAIEEIRKNHSQEHTAIAAALAGFNLLEERAFNSGMLLRLESGETNISVEKEKLFESLRKAAQGLAFEGHKVESNQITELCVKFSSKAV